MAKQTYGVDWSDGAFPEILRTEDIWDPSDGDRLTFAEAKQEIIDHFRADIEHARMMIGRTRALRVKDVRRLTEDER